MKEFKISCPHCQQHVAFPEHMIGSAINCPSCGLSVGLNVPGYTPQKKTHGVFYYVFWGVVSLIITGIILSAVWFLFLGGMVAFEQAKHDAERQKADATQKALEEQIKAGDQPTQPPKNILENEILKSLVANGDYLTTTDDFSGTISFFSEMFFYH